MTNEEMLSVAEIVERLVARFHKQAADHEAKMVEHRAAFGVRTEADAKIIARLYEELNQVRNSLGIQAAKEANKVLGMVDGEGLRGAAERVVKERDGLLTQVQDMRAEIDSLKREERATHDTLKPLVERVTSERDALRAEVAALKSHTPKHPVKVGEFVKRLTGFHTTPAGEIGRVTRVDDDDAAEIEYEVKRPNGGTGVWCAENCEPCDPPEATHDTETGKAVAKSAVSEPIKVGDTVEVFKSSSTWTSLDDVGKSGTVSEFETDVTSERIVHLREHPDDAFGLCDVRKVTT